MTATTPVAFDPKPRRLANVRTFVAGSAILRGQLVGAAATGVERSVVPCIETTSAPEGFALNSAASGEYVAVAGNGSELICMNAATNTDLDAGDYVSNSTVAGCTILLEGTVATHETEAAGYYPVGQCQEDSTAGSGTTGSTQYIIVNISPIWTAST